MTNELIELSRKSVREYTVILVDRPNTNKLNLLISEGNLTENTSMEECHISVEIDKNTDNIGSVYEHHSSGLKRGCYTCSNFNENKFISDFIMYSGSKLNISIIKHRGICEECGTEIESITSRAIELFSDVIMANTL